MSLELPSAGFQPKFFSRGPSRFHLPFLYDVIASHRPQRVVLLGFGGDELHFAICQAVREQELTTRCLTIRRSRAGENPEEDKAWREAVEKSEEFFPEVGTLLARDPVAEAAEHADRSVDLLLIDDCDSAATLQEELRAWQPKLAANALVLVHGTLLEREESVHAIWQKFSEDRPAYNFEQGIGLGVTSFGAETLPENSPLARLFASAEVRRDLLFVYDLIAGRINAQHRASEAERQKSALQLHQAWLDTLARSMESAGSDGPLGARGYAFARGHRRGRS